MPRVARSDTPWDPAPLSEVAALFARADGGAGAPGPARWWIAGGHAIRLAAGGRRYRDHGDVDVLLLRHQQLAAQHALRGWEWWAADPPGTLRRWAPGETLPPAVHDVWCRPGPTAPWRIQVMLDESEGRHWVSRRDHRVRLPLDAIGRVTAEGVPYLVPEVQLYYKALLGPEPRPKDERDFAAALPVLGDRERRWLARAIRRSPGAHPWAERLERPPG